MLVYLTKCLRSGTLQTHMLPGQQDPLKIIGNDGKLDLTWWCNWWEKKCIYSIHPNHPQMTLWKHILDMKLSSVMLAFAMWNCLALQLTQNSNWKTVAVSSFTRSGDKSKSVYREATRPITSHLQAAHTRLFYVCGLLKKKIATWFSNSIKV